MQLDISDQLDQLVADGLLSELPKSAITPAIEVLTKTIDQEIMDSEYRRMCN